MLVLATGPEHQMPLRMRAAEIISVFQKILRWLLVGRVSLLHF